MGEALGEGLGIVAGRIVDALMRAREAGMTKAEAEREIARQAERGDLVSDELWESLGSYVKTTEDFEKNGAG